MPRQVKCECGYIGRGETDDDVIQTIRDHLQTDHPDLSTQITDEQIRAWIETV